MKILFRLRLLFLLAAALTIAAVKSDAQGFGLSVTASSDSVAVSNTLTYTINVTNLTGFSLPDFLVTNTPSSNIPINITDSSASQAATLATNADDTAVIFEFFDGLPAGGIAQMTLTIQPSASGTLTNTIVVASDYITNTTSTFIVTQVTNSIPALANVSVTMTGPAQTVITNDWMTYGVTLTNFGSSDVTGVILTNTLPPGVIFKGVSPNHGHQTVAATNLVFNLGTLSAGTYTNLQLTVEPTNAGVLTFSATVGGNSASTNITVTNYLSGILMAVTNSAQVLNHQNGLEEQSVTVSNIGPTTATSVRVVVSGLTTKRLLNAFGTNDGNPFVVCAASLAVGESVNLLMQYAPRPSFPFTNSQLHAFAVPMPNLAPPTAFTTSTNVPSIQLTNSDLVGPEMLIEFAATTNRTYTVVYSDNVLFSNAMMALPSFTAPSSPAQWIDYGPPETVSAPAKAGARYYRVLQNP